MWINHLTDGSTEEIGDSGEVDESIWDDKDEELKVYVGKVNVSELEESEVEESDANVWVRWGYASVEGG